MTLQEFSIHIDELYGRITPYDASCVNIDASSEYIPKKGVFTRIVFNWSENIETKYGIVRCPFTVTAKFINGESYYVSGNLWGDMVEQSISLNN